MIRGQSRLDICSLSLATSSSISALGHCAGAHVRADLERRAGLAAMGTREVPVVPNELTGVRSVLTFDQRGNERPDGAVLVELGVVEDQD